MKVWIIGGNGFVGKYLALELVKQDYEVIICDIEHNKDHEVYKACSYKNIDVRDLESLKTLDISSDDVVINLAANQYHHKIPKNAEEFFFSVNTKGNKNLLDYCFSKGCKNYIFYSTDMTYGKPQFIPLTTEHPQVPFGFYGKSKFAAEQDCKDFRAKGMNVTIFRPRMIIGPGRLGILEKLFKLIKNNLPCPLIGNGSNHYQMISVFDCVEATIKDIKLGCLNEEFNLGSYDPPSVRFLLNDLIKRNNSKSFLVSTWGTGIKLILSTLGKLGVNLLYKEQYEIADKEYILDLSKTIETLNWKPKFSDDDMLNEAYQEFLKR